MSDIDTVRLRQLDLNLLMIFLGLMRHRKATVVAEEMGLTQSTVSHALGRLRTVLADELFLRKAHGLEPTAFAAALEPSVHDAVNLLRRAISGPTSFDPATAQVTLRLAASDLELATMIPAVLAEIRMAAPGVRLLVRALVRKEAIRALSAGEIDGALGYFWDVPDGIEHTLIRTETYRVVGPATHDFFVSRRALDAYCAADHLVVSYAGDFHGIVDRALAKSGRTRRVTVSVPYFFPALAALSRANMIATLPASLAERCAEQFGLVHVEPPLAIRSFPISLLTHKRDARNPAIGWLRTLLQSGYLKAAVEDRPVADLQAKKENRTRKPKRPLAAGAKT